MNKTKLPSFIPILILTLVTVVMWVSLDIYRAFKTPAESSVPAAVSTPLTPTLDQNSIKQIESRTFLNDSQIPANIISASTAPFAKATPIPTIVPVATLSGQLQNATSSGTIP